MRIGGQHHDWAALQPAESTASSIIAQVEAEAEGAEALAEKRKYELE